MRALTSETPTRTSTARTGALQKEIAIAAGEKVKLDEQEQLGVPAAMGCPECGGPLSRIDDPSITRFRCHVGHGYTARALLTDQSEQVERALGAAMRTLEERARLLADLAESTGSGASTTQAEALWKRVAEARAHAETLRQLLLAGVREDAA